jgi:hypothetical protein
VPRTGAHLPCHHSHGADVRMRALDALSIRVTSAWVIMKGVIELALQFVAVDVELWNDECKRQNML